MPAFPKTTQQAGPAKSVSRPADPIRALSHRRRPARWWLAMRFLLASSKNHAFLDRASIGWLFKICPPSRRHSLALHLLSLSPHYWIYQWTNKYDARYRRSQVLWFEYRRNAKSRKEICDKVLRAFLKPDMTVVDFGCGPGFLAKEASAHAKNVIGTDVSRGVVHCARHINAAENLRYVSNGDERITNIDDRACDLVYSFAVFQHLRKAQTGRFFEEFFRILKPGGQGVVHTILKPDAESAEHDPQGWVQSRVMLRMVYYSRSEITQMLSNAGFEDIRITQIKDMADVNDDIGQEQLVTFAKPPAT